MSPRALRNHPRVAILARRQAILAVTVPFFALVLLGWLAARAGLLPESTIPGLNADVLFFTLPCMLFRFGASLPLDRLADPPLLCIYLVAAMLMIAITIAVSFSAIAWAFSQANPQ